MRRMLDFFSPVIYVNQLKKFKEYIKPLAVKTICYSMVVIIFIIPPPKSLSQFEVGKAMGHIEKLIDPTFEGRVTGTRGNYLAGEYIVEQLKNYGVEPFFEDGYYHYYDNYITRYHARLNKNTYISYRKVKEGVANINGKSFEFNRHFMLQSLSLNLFEYPSIEEHGDVRKLIISDKPIKIQGKILDYSQEIGKPIPTFSEEEMILFVPAKDGQGNPFSFDAVTKYVKQAGIQTVVFEVPKAELQGNVPPVEEFTIIAANQELSEMIRSNAGLEMDMELMMSNEEYHSKARNIVGIIKGTDWETKSKDDQSYIVIGASYDGIYPGKDNSLPFASGASGAAINLEIARILGSLDKRPEQNIVFMFWDGEYGASGSEAYRRNKIVNPHYNSVYNIDLGVIGGSSTLGYFDESWASFEENSFDFVGYFKKRLKELGIENNYERFPYRRLENVKYDFSFNFGISSVDYEKCNTKYDTLKNLNKETIKNSGQIVLDTLIMYCYGGKDR